MIKFLKTIKLKWSGSRFERPARCTSCPHESELVISFQDRVLMRITRRSAQPPNNELTAIIPQALLRQRFFENGQVVWEEELSLSSLTLVDAPRHETGDRTQSPSASPINSGANRR
jgi:hypothetical protein